jgi:hypothetical protein
MNRIKQKVLIELVRDALLEVYEVNTNVDWDCAAGQKKFKDVCDFVDGLFEDILVKSTTFNGSEEFKDE